MSTISHLPEEISDCIGVATILEGAKGEERSGLLGDWARRTGDCRFWHVSVAFDEGGPWAGISDIFRALSSELPPEARDLLDKHNYELLSILPALRRELSPRNPCLTDVSSPSEQVRLYPADRAQRILHGLIDLLVECKRISDPSPWVFICDNFDESGSLAQNFFAHLLRRRGTVARIGVVAVCAPGALAKVADAFAPSSPKVSIRMSLSPGLDKCHSPQEMSRRAQELEAAIGEDPIEREINLPGMIRYWNASETPERALPWQLEAFSIYTSRGFYLDSIKYGDGALAQLDRHYPDDEQRRWKVINKLFACHCTTGNPERALKIVEETLARSTSLLVKALAHYVIAMLHARYLPEKNLELAEEHLALGIAYLNDAELPDDELTFQTVFNQNGLALVRHLQRRSSEAIRLCREGHALLSTRLAGDRHKLHRSVLLYNIAQVYSSLGESSEAIRHYTAAMEMDPNYSEYYNERGNLFFKNGLLDLALADYQQALALSPPFPEVRANLGHCHLKLGQIEEALRAYSDSLDLDCHQAGIYVMRAQCYEELGRAEEALEDYRSSLQLRPKQPLVLANRACLLYSEGRLQEALDDLDLSIEMAPDLPDLYQNRAAALIDMQRSSEAIHDLENYLRLNHEADDRDSVMLQIRTLKDQQMSVSA